MRKTLIMREEKIPETIVELPGYQRPYTVTGVKLQRNPPGGILTLAEATFTLRDGGNPTPAGDIVTRMRLADAVSHLHSLPVNKTSWYGRLGRNGPIGRKS